MEKKTSAAHEIEKGSLHPMGRVIAPHQTKQTRGMWDRYLKAISYISSKRG